MQKRKNKVKLVSLVGGRVGRFFLLWSSRGSLIEQGSVPPSWSSFMEQGRAESQAGGAVPHKAAGPHASRFPTSLPRHWTVDTPFHHFFAIGLWYAVAPMYSLERVSWRACHHTCSTFLPSSSVLPCVHPVSTVHHPSRQWPLSKPCQQCFAKGWRITVESLTQFSSKWLNVSGGSQTS